jgi:hypothetical protein
MRNFLYMFAELLFVLSVSVVLASMMTMLRSFDLLVSYENTGTYKQTCPDCKKPTSGKQEDP